MADVIMTFRYLNEVQVRPSKVLMRVGIIGAGNNMTMHIDYNPQKGIRIAEVFGNPVETNYVKTAKGLVKQVNAYFKQVCGDSPDTPVLHVKSFGLYNDRTSYPRKIKDYEVQDLTRIVDLFNTLTGKNASAGGQFPISCTVVNDDVYFYDFRGHPMNPLAGVDVSHGENAFCGSMIANGFKLVS